MGTTMTAVAVGDGEVAIAHVGDSRAYRLRDGELERLTHDHSLVDEMVRAGKLTPEEAEVHPQRSIITRALGPEPEVEVERMTYPARSGDVYLICSDGLTTMVPEDGIAAILRARSSLKQAGDGARARGERGRRPRQHHGRPLPARRGGRERGRRPGDDGRGRSRRAANRGRARGRRAGIRARA